MNTVLKKSEGSKLADELVEIDHSYDKEPRDFIEEHLYIKTKDQLVIPLTLNHAQRLIYKKVQEARSNKKPIRIIILKARQEGVSTLCEALIFERTARWQNTNSLIVAHEPESTESIFAMSKLFYDMLEPAYKPMRRYDNKKPNAV